MGMWVCFVWEVLIVFMRFFAGFFFVSKLSDVHIFFFFLSGWIRYEGL
jgi:hypothetical protein